MRGFRRIAGAWRGCVGVAIVATAAACAGGFAMSKIPRASLCVTILGDEDYAVSMP